MKWRKQGLIYAPQGDLWWAKSYATIPTVDVLDDRILRIYFASLDENRFGRIGYVDLDAENPSRILYESPEPILDLGEPGAFDDSGVNPSCVIKVGDEKYLYYIGWQRCERVPYMLFAGLATSIGDDRFVRRLQVPVLDRTDAEPFTRSATSIIFENGIFKNWYVSAFDWIVVDSVKYPTYVIKYATSADGIVWQSRDETCINFKDDDEFGFGRPWVVRDADKYSMWYSIRSKSAPYKIGYAESSDGINWIRKDDEAGIKRSDTGWDSEMICYPCVADAGGKRYMFYNGNRHGSTGFGFATLES
ncbi:MAG TPA: hypothetical protein VNI84_02795 [Pyrinomonadaceae bacterium]|nr:hypothetical protein [Pyrinomonadaceae bacterium]